MKLCKPNETNSDGYQLKVVRSSHKNEETSNKERLILRDFFQMFDFAFTSVIDPDNNILTMLFESVSSLLKCRLQIAYEKNRIKNYPIDYKNILNDNKEFLKELREKIKEYSSKEHMSYLDEARVAEMTELLRDTSSNVLDGYIHYSSYQDLFDDSRSAFLDQQFNILKSNKVYLGTNNPSKGAVRNINSELALCYYDILNDVNIKEEFLLVMTGKKSINSAHPSIRKVVKKLPEDHLLKFTKRVINRDFVVESLLLMYIVADQSKNFSIKDIEEHYDESELDIIQSSAEFAIEDDVDKMLLRRKIEIKEY